MKAPINIIYVQVEKKYEDEIKLSNLILYKDTTYEPEWNVVCHGTVVSVPGRVETHFAEPDFQCNVLPGDKLYFNYQTLLDEDNCVIWEGEEYWRVDYFNTIATVRDGEIYPVGSYVLVEPIDDEITHSFLIIPEMAKKKETNRGIVFKSNMAELPSGAIVEYDPIGKFENTIEGKKVFCMYNSNIYFKYEQEEAKQAN